MMVTLQTSSRLRPYSRALLGFAFPMSRFVARFRSSGNPQLVFFLVSRRSRLQDPQKPPNRPLTSTLSDLLLLMALYMSLTCLALASPVKWSSRRSIVPTSEDRHFDKEEERMSPPSTTFYGRPSSISTPRQEEPEDMKVLDQSARIWRRRRMASLISCRKKSRRSRQRPHRRKPFAGLSLSFNKKASSGSTVWIA